MKKQSSTTAKTSKTPCAIAKEFTKATSLCYSCTNPATKQYFNTNQHANHAVRVCDSCRKSEAASLITIETAKKRGLVETSAKKPTAKQIAALQALGEAAQVIGAWAKAQKVVVASSSIVIWYYTAEALKNVGIQTIEIFEDGDGKFRFRASLDGQIIYWGKGQKAYETKTAASAEKYLKGLYKALAS